VLPPLAAILAAVLAAFGTRLATESRAKPTSEHM
jgi:hypothetical protein